MVADILKWVGEGEINVHDFLVIKYDGHPFESPWIKFEKITEGQGIAILE
jgi:hypothetical protein